MSTVIVSACRTPFGAFGGRLRDLPATDLGSIVIRRSLERAGIPGSSVDYVLMGMVVQSGAGQIPSRQASLKAGLPPSVPSDTINKVCASSLRAVNMADMMIRSKDAKVVVAGGMENMSAVPYYLPQVRWGARLGNSRAVDGVVYDGLTCPFYDRHMGVHGDFIAKRYGISREEQDRWALSSQMKYARAREAGFFNSEIEPVTIRDKKGNQTQFSEDEHPRPDTTLERLANLRPAFSPDGTVTAGNAPGINDGAAALLLMDEVEAERLSLSPLARVVSTGAVSAEPAELGIVPAMSAEQALKKAGLTWDDMAAVEINEAFAAVTLCSIKVAGIDPGKVNVNGGAIAVGHAIGASGARILMTLIYELRNRGGGLGLACICSGAAQGEATLVEVF
ncbi:MAG: acetyl-CoA C-acetyltransferase [Bacillota bacterium]